MQVEAKARLGFIGLGVMGRSMARRLMDAGFPVMGHTRTPEKAEALRAAGMGYADSVAEVARCSDIIITMLGFPEDVRWVYSGSGGLLETAAKGALLMDMTTSAPALARHIHAEAAKRGIGSLDAPVSGGDVGARNGTLSIMVGGEAKDYAAALPVFRVLGKLSVHQGGPGDGQRVKLCNQIGVFGNTLGACEALAFAVRAGLAPAKVLESIGAGAASSWALSNLAPRMVAGDFEPGFFVRHFLKDIRLALDEARSMGMALPGMDLAAGLFGKLEEGGFGDKGTQALFMLLERGLPLEADRLG